MMNNIAGGAFITFEGCEGCGKSYQSKKLHSLLENEHISSILVREPGSTPLGERVARWLKWDGDGDMSPYTELLLFNAARSELVNRTIRPALARDTVIVCDRFADSTTAYQGYGRQLDLATVAGVNAIGTGGLSPDLTILLDIEPESGLERKGCNHDRFEQEDLAFHQRVRNGFLKLAEQELERWIVIDARQSRQTITGIIWKTVQDLLSRQK